MFHLVLATEIPESYRKQKAALSSELLWQWDPKGYFSPVINEIVPTLVLSCIFSSEWPESVTYKMDHY